MKGYRAQGVEARVQSELETAVRSVASGILNLAPNETGKVGGRVFVLPSRYARRISLGRGSATLREVRLVAGGPKLVRLGSVQGNPPIRHVVRNGRTESFSDSRTRWRLRSGTNGQLIRGITAEGAAIGQAVFHHESDWPTDVDTMSKREWRKTRPEDGRSYHQKYRHSLEDARRLKELYGSAVFVKIPLAQVENHGLGVLSVHTFKGHTLDNSEVERATELLISHAQALANVIASALKIHGR